MQRLIILAAIFFTGLMVWASPTVLEADSAYNREDYQQALRLYNKVLEEEGASPTVYYNLGNTYFRLNNIGHAVLNYERALKLAPSFEDARTNLNFVNTRIEDKPEDDSSFLGNLFDKIVCSASPDSWAWLTFIAFFLVLGAAAAYIFANNVAVRKVGFFGGIILIFATIGFMIVALDSASRIKNHDAAIVMTPTTNLTSAPRAPKGKTEKVVPIHEGTRLIIVDSVVTPGDEASHMYYDVKINNSTRAWVKASDVERI